MNGDAMQDIKDHVLLHFAALLYGTGIKIDDY